MLKKYLMKNIHLIPTDKARLYIHQGKLYDHKKTMHIPDGTQIPHHIYITSLEDIKDCNCYVTNVIGVENGSKQYVFKPILVDENIVRKEPLITYPNGGWCEKIILTTDPSLIADGVQAIDDTFLEWFVKNPNCEYVRVNDICDNVYVGGFLATSTHIKYEIILHKEEVKCEGCDGKGFLDETDGYDYGKVTCPVCVNDKTGSLEECIKTIIDDQLKTLEEAADEYAISVGCDTGTADVDFIEGGKWMEQRRYSEEEVLKLLNKFSHRDGITEEENRTLKWFEQNKKK